MALLLLLSVNSRAQECPDDVDSNHDHTLIVFAVDGLLGRVVTHRYMPLLFEHIKRGAYTTSMRTTHDTRHAKLGWISAFFASSSSEFGCDDNGCDSVPRVDDDMRSWVSMLEEDHGYVVDILSERKDVMEDVLERDDVDGFKQCTMRLFRHTENLILPNAHRRILVINIGCVDRLGHVSGFGGANYFQQVACLDRQLSYIVDQMWQQGPNSTTFMLVVNHGGSGFDHNTFDTVTVEVPFAMWGYGVKQHAPFWTLASEVEQIGPSLFVALGYQDCIPSTWLYRPIDDIYDSEDYAAYIPPAEEIPRVDREECYAPQSVDHKSARRTADIYTFVILAVLAVVSIVVKRIF